VETAEKQFLRQCKDPAIFSAEIVRGNMIETIITITAIYITTNIGATMFWVFAMVYCLWRKGQLVNISNKMLIRPPIAYIEALQKLFLFFIIAAFFFTPLMLFAVAEYQAEGMN